MNKKIYMLGIPLLALALVSAAVLSYFGIWTGVFTTVQAVEVESFSGTWTGIMAGSSSNECNTDDKGYLVKNNANVPIDVKFGTTCSNSEGYDDGVRNNAEIDWSTFSNDRCDGIETEIYGILELTSKTASWVPDTRMEGTLKYTIVGSAFEYKFEAERLTANTEYVLIYYADDSNRFVNWGGAPALELGRTTSDVNGDLVLTGNVGIAGGLPYASDWNTNANPGYCNGDNGFDYFEHCTGAKIWLILADDYNGNNVELTAWNQMEYLFETDLIVYSDDVNDKITLPANGGGFNFCVENDFALNLVGDTYTIETQIIPTI